MRPIGTLATHDDAVRFADYLLTIGLRNHVEPTRDGSAYLVWIEHDDDIDQGQLQLRQFQANPNDPRYDDAGAAARAVRKQEAVAALRRRRNYTDVRTSWAGLPRHGAAVTLTTIAICVVVFLLQQTKLRDFTERWLLFYTPLTMRDISEEDLRARVEASPDLMRRIERGEDLPADVLFGTFGFHDAFGQIERGQVWRLITPAFMHGSIPHIVFNCWSFLAMGAVIESRKGRATMLAIILIGGVLSCCGQAAWDAVTPHGGFGFVGLSGVVYAVFGYAWMRGRVAPQDRIGVNPQYVGMMIGWLFLCMTGLVGPIANAAHVVGLLAGMLIGLGSGGNRKVMAPT